MKFENKYVVVTGGTSGIGKSIVYQFAREGANVAFIGRNAQAGDEITKNVAADSSISGMVAFYQCDVSDPHQVEQTASCILLDFKSVDVLINNAGANFVKGSLEEHTLQLYQKTMDTNMMSYFLFAKFFIPNMVKHETGCVINIASTMGLRGAQDHLAYTISKGANITFTQSLALDYASCGIRINAIAPGLIDTPATEDWIKSQEDPGKAKGVPLGRAGTSEEIAHAAVFLASEEASYITGTVLVVDGGLSVGE